MFMFYHIKNLQSTKTRVCSPVKEDQFYHIKNLQSTKTVCIRSMVNNSFITLRIYKVLKLKRYKYKKANCLSH